MVIGSHAYAGDALPVPGAVARGIAARCETRVNVLARHMTRDAFARLPGYDELPSDVKDVEIAATARHGLRLFLDRVAAPDGMPGEVPGDYEYFRERAAQRADEGMPLRLLLSTHLLGTQVLWRALRDATRRGEEAALAELSDFLFTAQERVVAAVTETYLDERAAVLAERREERRSLARALLEGAPVGDEGAAFGGGCVVLFLSLPSEGGGARPVASRRLVRRVQAALDRTFGGGVLTLLDGAGGHAVVPGDIDVVEVPDGLGVLLAEVCGGAVRVGVAGSGGVDGIPAAARTAEEVVRVARACGRPPGPHRLDDVLLEYHLSRPSAGSERIAALLEPVAERPELTETLRAYLELRQDRRATARRLSLHPNTVDNRLARVAALTGLDLTSSYGTALALAALLLREVGGEPGA
ncbi:PucR family transcriptional regulator [Streptomyces kanamyceticus]|uniref:PucR family transcriptional regulator n=1 Tax=Streptomyces kanamyceticus TaxID=1967 RepID=A0A5J6GH05_STRKN|nr:helix-turn-helix domain-containing protein [Streptomyces kanamyceticus]QEU93291.1 PucR family transcriptional regulator [Streptomyces kanamyceticus]